MHNQHLVDTGFVFHFCFSPGANMFRDPPNYISLLIDFKYSFFQLLTHKIFSCHTIFETSHSKCKTTHQISKTIRYFSAFDSGVNCIKHLFQNTIHNSLPKTQKSNRKWLAFLFPNATNKNATLIHQVTHSSHVQTLIA